MNAYTDRAEIVLWVRHEDGRWSARTVWVVVLNGLNGLNGRYGQAYVRSAFGRRSAWYLRVLRGADTAVEVAGVRMPVTLRPVDDLELVERVSGAYRAKYGSSWPGPVESMNGPEAAATTMRLTDIGQVTQLSA
ncbi:DUF2255 family protein [Streptomyces sp. NBC_00190]|uniref:DUF2255 family protein n=1 Tax=Streptomyces sp. NBC_00190 TaxID=2903634 RepID=UPI002E2A8CF6|nr:DUF2255 family protein [Streptomyces sp. NBC_00190]